MSQETIPASPNEQKAIAKEKRGGFIRAYKTVAKGLDIALSPPYPNPSKTLTPTPESLEAPTLKHERSATPIPNHADIFVEEKKQLITPQEKPTTLLPTSIKDKLLVIKKSAEQKVSRVADVSSVWLFLSLMKPQIIRKINPEYAEGFDGEFTEIMKDPNVVPFILTNHEGMADAVIVALMSRKLTKLINKARGFDDSILKMAMKKVRNIFTHNLLGKDDQEKKGFDGLVLTMAKSLENNGNGQGEFIEEAVRQLQPWFKKNNLALDGYVREKDQEKFGLPRSINFKHNRKLYQDIKNGKGRALFPEASVESGRFTENTNRIRYAKRSRRNTEFDELLETIRMNGKQGEAYRIKGMQEFDKSIDFNSFIEIARKNGKEVVFIVAGSHGAFRITDHNGSKPIPTWHAWKACLNPGNIPILGDSIKASLELMADIKIDDNLMDVKVGMPIKASDMIKEIMEKREDKSLDGQKPTRDELSNYLGRKIAELLPEDARGFYK